MEALTDGIFAISMTLLVLGLSVPQVPQDQASTAIRDTLTEDWPMFEDYALSFLLLAAIWVAHHRQSRFIKRIDESFLWLNILALMLVALVPFSTEIMSSYNNVQEAALVFDLNLLGIGIMYFFMWRYATRSYRLIDRDELDEAGIASANQYTLVLPGVSLVAIIGTFVSPGWNEMAFILVPIILALMRRRDARRVSAVQTN